MKVFYVFIDEIKYSNLKDAARFTESLQAVWYVYMLSQTDTRPPSQQHFYIVEYFAHDIKPDTDYAWWEFNDHQWTIAEDLPSMLEALESYDYSGPINAPPSIRVLPYPNGGGWLNPTEDLPPGQLIEIVDDYSLYRPAPNGCPLPYKIVFGPPKSEKFNALQKTAIQRSDAQG